jgi:uncharacterized RDD family membrane protein YckC
VRLGLPESGPGSVAGFGPRLGAFALDCVASNLLAGVPLLFGVHYGHGVSVLVAFMLMETVLVAATGQTLGMMFLHLRVVRLEGGLQKPGWILARAALLFLVIPALIWDRDGRGLHDRAAGVVVVRDPARAEPESADSESTESGSD